MITIKYYEETYVCGAQIGEYKTLSENYEITAIED